MNTTTNTSGIIAAAAEKKEPAKKKTPAQELNRILNNAQVQNQINEATKGNSGAFTASLLNLFNNDGKLQLCEPKLVLIEALKAAVLNLPIEKSLGFAYVIPYSQYDKETGKSKYIPQFQLGYKGMIQLCMRTGEYKYINADVVYEGEYQGADKLTGHVDLNGEKTSDEIIGYFAYIETLNGFKKAIYWSKDKVLKHAITYSKSKDKDKNLKGAWKDNFDEMAIKTVIRNLISKYGIMSIEMANALQAEETPAELPETTSKEIEATADEIPVSAPVPDNAEIAPPVENTDADDDYPFPR